MKKTEEQEPIGMPDPEQEQMLERLFRIAGTRASIPEEVNTRVKSAVREHWKETVRARSRRKTLLIFAGAAAAFFAFFALSLQIYFSTERVPVGIVENIKGDVQTMAQNGRSSSLEVGSTLVKGAVVNTDHSGRLLLRLVGGSSLRMDVDTSLSLESESTFVLKHGAVYFDSGKTGRPIALITRLGTIRDMGTQFEVALDDGQVRIRVREGVVLLDGQGVSRTTLAGSELVVRNNGNQSTESVASYGSQWDWISQISPSLELEGHSLAEFLEWVARENGWRLDFSDDSARELAAKTILHGSVRGLRPDQMPEAVFPVTGFTYSINNGVLTVTAK
ncbi:MAG TPA: FecR domain-containing protein [Acidobacteriota bacterium]|nr:FecR domain-containing protein [Acidobacteriota bacterium]